MSKLYDFRKDAGMTREQLAKDTGVNITLLAKYETGLARMDRMALKTAAAIAAVLGVHAEDLLEPEIPAGGLVRGTAAELLQISKEQPLYVIRCEASETFFPFNNDDTVAVLLGGCLRWTQSDLSKLSGFAREAVVIE